MLKGKFPLLVKEVILKVNKEYISAMNKLPLKIAKNVQVKLKSQIKISKNSYSKIFEKFTVHLKTLSQWSPFENAFHQRDFS